jgi:hypothetical protein
VPIVGYLRDAILEEEWARPGGVVVQANAGGGAIAVVGDGGRGVIEDYEAHVLEEWVAVLYRGKGEGGQENDKTALDGGWYGRENEGRD